MPAADDIEADAYSAWEMLEHERAGELFLEAERLTRPFEAVGQPRRSFLLRTRGGMCLWDAGLYERARPILQEVVVFDYQSAGLWNDRHDVEKAYVRLLMERAAESDGQGFALLWNQAAERGRQLDWSFPQIIKHQKQLLNAAMALGNREVCRSILERINPKYLREDHELRLMSEQATRFLADRPVPGAE